MIQPPAAELELYSCRCGATLTRTAGAYLPCCRRRGLLNAVPALVVVLLAAASGAGTAELERHACTTDGPQYRCWLEAEGG